MEKLKTGEWDMVNSRGHQKRHKERKRIDSIDCIDEGISVPTVIYSLRESEQLVKRMTKILNLGKLPSVKTYLAPSSILDEGTDPTPGRDARNREESMHLSSASSTSRYTNRYTKLISE